MTTTDHRPEAARLPAEAEAVNATAYDPEEQL